MASLDSTPLTWYQVSRNKLSWQIFCSTVTEPLLHDITCTKYNKMKYDWHLEKVHIPYRGASPSYIFSPVIWKDRWQAGTPVCHGSWVRTVNPKLWKGKSGPSLFSPIKSQNSLTACTNHMFMGKAWIKCTISILNIVTVLNRYSPGACHGSGMFPPEACTDAKLVNKQDFT